MIHLASSEVVLIHFLHIAMLCAQLGNRISTDYADRCMVYDAAIARDDFGRMNPLIFFEVGRYIKYIRSRPDCRLGRLFEES